MQPGHIFPLQAQDGGVLMGAGHTEAGCDHARMAGLTPAAVTGIVPALVFLIALFALYARHLYGKWRWIYALGAVFSLYLNVFVLIVQMFNKLKFVNPAAPMLGNAAGPPFAPPTDFHFAVAQGVTLVIFVMLGLIAAIKFRRGPV